MFEAAREVADEFILNNGPRIRPTGEGDLRRTPTRPTSQGASPASSSTGERAAAIAIPTAASSPTSNSPTSRRSARRSRATGACGSSSWARRAVHQPEDIVEELGSQAPKALTDLMAGIRDDIRDSWHSKGNREGLKRLIRILRTCTGAVPTSTSSTSAATSMSRTRSRFSRSGSRRRCTSSPARRSRTASTRPRQSLHWSTWARRRSARCWAS